MRRVAAVISASLLVAPAFAQVGVERTVLLREPLHIPGHEILLVDVSIEPGGREGRHRHAGALVAKVLQGHLSLEFEGQPTQYFGPGDSVLIPAGQIHEGINTGDEPVLVIATFVVPLDEPLTTQIE